MIVDRYEPLDVFALVPQLTLAMDPELAELDHLLEDDAIVLQVKNDLTRRHRHSRTRGRHSTPVEVILRMLVIRRLYDWSYEETEHFVADSLVLRQFCRVYLEAVPDDTTLIRWANLIGPTTLQVVHDRVVELARTLKVARGRKLRTDGTVVETTMHHPTDSSLLSDGIRVVSRLVKRAKGLVGDAVASGQNLFRDRTRSAKRQAHQIGEALRRRGEQADLGRRDAYRRLLAVTEASLDQASSVQRLLAGHSAKAAAKVQAELARVVPLIEQVIDQTGRRVFEGQSVPAAQKLVSLFEPHTRIIRRGKARQPTEFGRMVWLDEVDGGIVSRYQILAGNPSDASHVGASLAHHQRVFGRPPAIFTGDRGVHTAENELSARLLGVERVALPQPGAKSGERRAYERQRWFRRALRFRAGVEGRISVLKRRGFLGRCRDKGENGFGRWIGWGVITANLTTIARTSAARS